MSVNDLIGRPLEAVYNHSHQVLTYEQLIVANLFGLTLGLCGCVDGILNIQQHFSLKVVQDSRCYRLEACNIDGIWDEDWSEDWFTWATVPR